MGRDSVGGGGGGGSGKLLEVGLDEESDDGGKAKIVGEKMIMNSRKITEGLNSRV